MGKKPGMKHIISRYAYDHKKSCSKLVIIRKSFLEVYEILNSKCKYD